MDAHNNPALRKKYSAALMSNQKWRKLFLVMSEFGSELSGIEYHFTDTQEVFFGASPNRHQVWKTAIDDPVEGAGGPVEYKHIESIFIPNVYAYRAYNKAPVTEHEQNIELFLNELCKVGSFPITHKENGILISGYEI